MHRRQSQIYHGEVKGTPDSSPRRGRSCVWVGRCEELILITLPAPLPGALSCLHWERPCRLLPSHLAC